MAWKEKLPSVANKEKREGNEFVVLARALKEFGTWIGEIGSAGAEDYRNDIKELLGKKLEQAFKECENRAPELEKSAKVMEGEEAWKRYQDNLKNCGIFEELELAGSMLAGKESRETKVDKGQVATDTIKYLLKKPFGWWAKKWVQDLIDSLFKVINELLKLLK